MTQNTLLYSVKSCKIKDERRCPPVYYPIWWDEAPMVISTFLESYDFSGKTIIPFCTSSSDSIDNSLHIFSELAPDAVIAEGLTANDDTDIGPWLERLGVAAIR